MIKAVIFDFDGVLVESADIKTSAFSQLFEHEGKKVVCKVVEYHLKNSGVSRFEKIRHIYGTILKKKLTEENFRYLCDKFAQMVVDEVVFAPYVKGAREFLEKYADKYKFFVVSATPQDELVDIVRRRGITSYFHGVYGTPSIKTDIIRDIILTNFFLPSECIYIGDALSDYNAAILNDLNFIARVNVNDTIFRKIDCRKIRDFKRLDKIIKAF